MNYLELSEIEQKQVIEALIFSADEPLSASQIFNLLVIKVSSPKKDATQQPIQIENDSSNEDLINSITEKIHDINRELAETNRPFGIIEQSGSYQYAVRPEYGELLQQVSRHKIKKRLSQAALEVLAIVAYKQPISKPEIEQIRGVNSNEVVNSLMEKNFIEISGKSENLGRPLLYSTTDEFLRAFGINSLEELPKLKEFDELSGFDSRPDNLEEGIIDIEVENGVLPEVGFEFIKIIKPEDMVFKRQTNEEELS